ncbi:hypothetical protein JCGZ_19312 [Jatropha curcas]|uniref:Aminotransferase-like plant mobile domain-containing protein n=1 Tax=Jatropha curcas TaxID=180498 RepID=A0A067K128_JATCU|nr:hypothetical protein JCGZ_19312 [Jatropha curcas]
MSHLPEIPASAYTPEMETLGAIPDISTFDGEPVAVSRNPLTSGTRPLQLLPLPGTKFPVRYETSRMHGFQTEVDLGKAHSGGSSTDTSAFWDLLDPPMRARVVAAGFGDYVAGLRRTQPRFPPTMRYALMERWNDCIHTFVFGFGEMTLTLVDYAAITGLRFAGPVAPMDVQYQTATLGAQLVRSLLGVTTQTRISSQLLCTSQNKGDPAVLVCLRDLGQVGSFDWATLALAHLYHGLDVWTRGSGESNRQFTRRLEVWAYEYRIYPGGPSGDTPVDSRRIPQYLAHCHHTYASTEDPEYRRSFLNDRVLSDGMTAEDREEEYEGSAAGDFLSACDYPAYFSTRMQARLPEERKTHKTPAHYRAETTAEAEAAAPPARAGGGVLGDVPFPPGMEVVLDPGLGLGSAIIIPADLRQAPPPPQLDPKHATHDLEIGRLQRHQSHQSGAMARLQMEVDRLLTRLEVEGIPLDFSEDDDDGSSSNDAPPSPPPQAAAGPSRRRW